MKRTLGIVAMATVLMLPITTFGADKAIATKPAETKIAKTAKPATATVMLKINKVTVLDDVSTQKMLQQTLINQLGTAFDKNGAAEIIVSVAWSGVGVNRTLVLRTNFKSDIIEKTATLKGIQPASDMDGAQLLATDAAKQLVTEYLVKSGAAKKVALRDPKTSATTTASTKP